MNKNKISRTNAVKMMENSKGKFFSVLFTKRTTGEDRKMVVRMGVVKGTKGQKMAYNPKKYDLITVFDVAADHHKTIPVDGLKYIKIGKKNYKVAQA